MFRVALPMRTCLLARADATRNAPIAEPLGMGATGADSAIAALPGRAIP